MPAKQLKISDLKPGDIMLQVGQENSWLSKGIKFAMRFQHNSQFIHSMIHTQSGGIMEMDPADGLSESHLREGDNPSKGYIVFRAKDPVVGEAAVSITRQLSSHINAEDSKGVEFDMAKAIASVIPWQGSSHSSKGLEDILSGIEQGKDTAMYCSQFVTWIIQLAAEREGYSSEQLLSDGRLLLSPAELCSALVNKEKEGVFAQAGYMMPDDH